MFAFCFSSSYVEYNLVHILQHAEFVELVTSSEEWNHNPSSPYGENIYTNFLLCRGVQELTKRPQERNPIKVLLTCKIIRTHVESPFGSSDVRCLSQARVTLLVYLMWSAKIETVTNIASLRHDISMTSRHSDTWMFRSSWIRWWACVHANTVGMMLSSRIHWYHWWNIESMPLVRCWIDSIGEMLNRCMLWLFTSGKAEALSWSFYL